MKNIHILPTDKPSRVWTDLNGNFYLHPIPTTLFFMQNIYITSNEKPKEGDWYYYFGHIIKYNSDENTLTPNCKKITLTKDQDLIKDGVQEIDDEFLEWFVKNPSCENVEINCIMPVNWIIPVYNAKKHYKTIIPQEETNEDEHYLDSYGCTKNEFELSLDFKKEEPRQDNCCTPIGQIKRYVDCVECDRNPKQLTVEEVLLLMRNTLITFVPNKRRYSEEEVEEIFKQAQLCAVKADGVYFKYENFEQFKNK
jgi:hypothetical protein